MAYCHVTNKQSKWYPCQDKGLSISAQSITKIVPVKGLPTIPPYDFWQKKHTFIHYNWYFNTYNDCIRFMLHIWSSRKGRCNV